MKALGLVLVGCLAFGVTQGFADDEKPAAAKTTDGNPATDLPVPKIVNDEAPEETAKGPAGESFSAAVNVIRKIDRTEVVFRNGESYYLPSGSKYNQIYNACLESEQTGKAISVTVNPKTRVILSVGAGGGTNKTK